MALVSKSEYARMHGVSHTAVNKWQRAGWLVMQGSRVDVDASDAKLVRYRNSADGRASKSRGKVSKRPKPETEVETVVPVVELLPGESVDAAAERLTAGTTIDLQIPVEEAKRIKEVYLALLNRLDYEQKSGALIELAAAEQVVFGAFRAQRDSWLNWPVRFGPMVAADLGIEESDRVTAILTDYVHRQLEQLSSPDVDFTAS
ncbi:hypothetical protein [Castellaniella sp. MT123]|uniref:hypothetical protein n=1 Tax=Castellaniella sp. MT123 TaxID=3140381 RepID=UPI0031F3C6CD